MVVVGLNLNITLTKKKHEISKHSADYYFHLLNSDNIISDWDN